MAFVLFAFAAARANAAPTHWIVISDIDDTIRNTGVVKTNSLANSSGAHPKNYAQLIRDPFCHNHWTDVPGMAAHYTRWRAHDHAEFVYLSCGPWFYRTWLTSFFWADGFPHGRICLNPLFPFSKGYKDAAIRRILRANPDGAFVFIGDSGEHDPEIYGRLARGFPKSEIRIFIRNITPLDPPSRYPKATPGSPWVLFTCAAQLPAALDRPAKLPARHDQTSPAHRR